MPMRGEGPPGRRPVMCIKEQVAPPAGSRLLHDPCPIGDDGKSSRWAQRPAAARQALATVRPGPRTSVGDLQRPAQRTVAGARWHQQQPVLWPCHRRCDTAPGAAHDAVVRCPGAGAGWIGTMAVVQRIAGARVKDVDPVMGIGHDNLLHPAAANRGADRVFCVRAISPAADGPRPADRRLQATIEATGTASWPASIPVHPRCQAAIRRPSTRSAERPRLGARGGDQAVPRFLSPC
jgi:hypothetical protein